jgi:hypothetical protein
MCAFANCLCPKELFDSNNPQFNGIRMKITVLGRLHVTMAWRTLRTKKGGDGHQIWNIATNILNKQLLTAHNKCSSSWGFGHGAKKLTVKKC